jgi:hypothetical protein
LVESKSRYTAKDALNHPWIRKHCDIDKKLEMHDNVIKRIASFTSASKF